MSPIPLAVLCTLLSSTLGSQRARYGIARAGLMGARMRSGGAQAGKRTWGRRRVRRIGVLRRAACGHQSAAICKQGGGELGAHERSQVGQGERQGAAIPLLEGRTSENRFRNRRRLQTETSQEGELPGTPTLP